MGPAVKEIETNQEVPTSFDARTQWSQCGGISKIRDQSACGSCWAFGSVDSFQDRACIATGKDIRYSPEDTAFCSNAGMGCNGGNSAWNWFQSSGVVTGGDYFDVGKGDTCLPYSLKPCAHHAPGSSKYQPCPSGEYPSPRCKRECSESGYAKSYQTDKVKASSAYSVRGVSKIQSDLMTNGPLYVAFTVYSDFPTYKSGVYKHHSSQALGGHAVELIGWGTENGQDYWLIKNSWNEQWGDHGTFKIARGSNECGIESSVSGGTISGAWEDIVADVNSRNTTWTAAVPEKFESVEEVKSYLGAFLPGDEQYTEPAVKEIETNQEVPTSFDARTKWSQCGGISKIRDQSACGSCWA